MPILNCTDNLILGVLGDSVKIDINKHVYNIILKNNGYSFLRKVWQRV